MYWLTGSQVPHRAEFNDPDASWSDPAWELMLACDGQHVKKMTITKDRKVFPDFPGCWRLSHFSICLSLVYACYRIGIHGSI